MIPEKWVPIQGWIPIDSRDRIRKGDRWFNGIDLAKGQVHDSEASAKTIGRTPSEYIYHECGYEMKDSPWWPYRHPPFGGNVSAVHSIPCPLP